MRFLKVLFAASVVLFVFIYTKAASADYRYIGPAKSNKYHYPSCRWARKFRSDDPATFRSAKEALGAGYVPCKVCNPPTQD